MDRTGEAAAHTNGTTKIHAGPGGIHAGISLRDPSHDTHRFKHRLLIICVFVVVMLMLLMGRMWSLQVTEHAHFTTLSHDNRVKLSAVPPTRGLVFDRHGAVLAQNVPAYRLEIVPEQVADLDETLARLGELVELRDIDIQRFYRQLARKRDFQPVPLRFHLTDEEVARFAVNRHAFPGVDIEAHLARHYPKRELTAHAVGYVGRIDQRDLERVNRSAYRGTNHIGKTGVERYYEELLHGTVGHEQVEINAQGRVLRTLDNEEPKPGRNIHLTLDTRLQEVATEALGEEHGAVVAMDPNNGDILAIASTPSYDPQPFVNGLDPEHYRQLQLVDSRPMFDRAMRGRYPPGSTIKPFFALAGLAEGAKTAEESLTCRGFYKLPNYSRRFRDWRREGHGRVDLKTAVAESCDIYFYDLARKLGIERMQYHLERFGFGRPTGIDSTGEQGGLVPSVQWKMSARGEPWFPAETLITGIGQGYLLTTPLQLAAATAAIANHGQRVQPRLVHMVEHPENGEREIWEPVWLDPIEVHNDTHWDHVVDAMVHSVHGPRGTARAVGADAPYEIAGKTGTSQVIGIPEGEEYEEDEIPKKYRDHALFIAFAPADDPQIAVAVIVENGGSGGRVAAPMARKVMDAYLLERVAEEH